MFVKNIMTQHLKKEVRRQMTFPVDFLVICDWVGYLVDILTVTRYP